MTRREEWIRACPFPEVALEAAMHVIAEQTEQLHQQNADLIARTCEILRLQALAEE